jgi:four helix bundle protein
MTQDELKRRTKTFALRVMKLVDALPMTISGRAIARQLMDSASSTAANYRSACRARSRADFLSKITVVEEEADESLFWLEMIEEGKLIGVSRLQALQTEAHELVAIFTSIGKTTKRTMRPS